MGVSYKRLKKLMVEYNLKLYQIKEATGLSNVTMSKINKNQFIQLDKLEKICEYLEKVSGKRIGFSDIMERTWNE